MCSFNGYFVDLFVRKSNAVAIGMYEKLGYIVHREVINYYSGEENAYGKEQERSGKRKKEKGKRKKKRKKKEIEKERKKDGKKN